MQFDGYFEVWTLVFFSKKDRQVMQDHLAYRFSHAGKKRRAYIHSGPKR